MKPAITTGLWRVGAKWFCSRPSSIAAILFLGLLWIPPVGAQNQQPAAAPEPWMNLPPTSTGLAIGDKIPSFRAPDQSGRIQDFNSIRGPKGAAIYFVRSADW